MKKILFIVLASLFLCGCQTQEQELEQIKADRQFIEQCKQLQGRPW